MIDDLDTVPAPPPIETIPPLPEITEIDNTIPEFIIPELESEEEVIDQGVVINTTVPCMMVLLSIATLFVSAFYCLH